MSGIRHKESMSIKLLRNTYSTQGKALSPPSFLPKGGTVLHNMAPRGCLRGVPQSEARASELPRLAVVAAVVPLLLLVVEFSSSLRVARGSRTMRSLRRSSRRRAHPGGLHGPTQSGCAACYTPEVMNMGPISNRGSGGGARGCGFEERVGVHARIGGIHFL